MGLSIILYLFLPHTDQADGVDQEQLLRKRRRGLLRMYYGVDEEDQRKKQEDVLNINSTHFKADKYLEQLYKTSDLQHLKTEKEKTKAGMSLNLDSCYCTVS